MKIQRTNTDDLIEDLIRAENACDKLLEAYENKIKLARALIIACIDTEIDLSDPRESCKRLVGTMQDIEAVLAPAAGPEE